MRLINKLKNNDALYCRIKLWKHRKDKNLRKILLAYFKSEQPLVWGNVNKENDINNKVFRIDLSSSQDTGAGFFALLRRTLEYLYVADLLNLNPVVIWGNNVPYAEKHPINGSSNPYEYYFNPVSRLDPNSSYVTFESNPALRLLWGKNSEVYDIDKEDIHRLHQSFKKYVSLNEVTKEYVDNSLSIITNKKTLGIHVRGTDYWQLEAKHPNPITIEDYLNKCHELFDKGHYDQVFIATDSLEALKTFKSHFGDKLVYFTDVVRSDGNVGVHLMKNDENNHHYKLGLEVLRDALALASCDSLIAGKSKVGEASRLIKDDKFKELVIIDHGTISKS